MNAPAVCLSIVSHGHSGMLPPLLEDIRALWHARNRAGLEIQLTFNLVDEDRRWVEAFADLPLKIHVNPSPLGFGSNQNAAFLRTDSPQFAIVNPDIRMPGLDLAGLQRALDVEDVGAAAPRVVDSAGVLQDSARRFPTLASLVRRSLTGRREPEIVDMSGPRQVDWVAGMFVLFRREAWAGVQGFDTRYFMYFEDVDLCRRLHAHGWGITYDSRFTVQHDAQRASHRDRQHLRWHLRSAVRYFTGW